MNFVNPWLSLFSFVYFIAAGFLSFLGSKYLVSYYLEKVNSKLLRTIEPLVGVISFCSFFGIFLIILYNILT
tara:strand:+ start:197 stop:412 length:216 start_codon:yes stop_codon:yes gene_type:complete